MTDASKKKAIEPLDADSQLPSRLYIWEDMCGWKPREIALSVRRASEVKTSNPVRTLISASLISLTNGDGATNQWHSG